VTEEQINETLTALLAPLLKNCTVKVTHRMIAPAHGIATSRIYATLKGKKYSATVNAYFTVDGGAVLLSDRDKFINDAINALGREVFKA